MNISHVISVYNSGIIEPNMTGPAMKDEQYVNMA